LSKTEIIYLEKIKAISDLGKKVTVKPFGIKIISK
jgi:hypothetical protein